MMVLMMRGSPHHNEYHVYNPLQTSPGISSHSDLHPDQISEACVLIFILLGVYVGKWDLSGELDCSVSVTRRCEVSDDPWETRIL